MDKVSIAAEEAKKAAGGIVEDGVDDFHRWNDRTALIESIKVKLRTQWRKDPKILNQFFQSCHLNWKVYNGEKTQNQILTLQALYKQATQGDCNTDPPSDLTSLEGQKWIYHNKFKGTSPEMAKRRYITFLAEIHPSLIDVMPSEKPPPGFPLSKEGIPICAKCNTLVGCIRPILDQNKGNLHQQLFEAEELSDPETLKLWVRNALANQRCIWGLHRPITSKEAKQFSEWFELDENRGFVPYSSVSILSMVRSFVHSHYETAFRMMNKRKQQEEERAKAKENGESIGTGEIRDDETITFVSSAHDSDYVDAETYNNQAIRCMAMKEIYEQFSGEEFKFELPCDRDNEECNKRRLLTDGKNHKHEVAIDDPIHFNRDTFEESIFLRKECQRLGINPSTGVVKDINQRCEIYRQKIKEHLQKVKQAELSRIKNENRANTHTEEKIKVKKFSNLMMKKQCHEACNFAHTDHILTLLKRGCDPDEESSRGLTPLITMVVNQESVEKVEYVINKRANVNHINKYGLSALMYSCRSKDVKMVHLLLKNEAKLMLKGPNGLTALHICIQNNCEEILKIFIDFVRDGIGDLLRVNRFLDYQDNDGNTALMLAAKIRNCHLCYLLSSLGASQTIRNRDSKTAANFARSMNHVQLAEWLEKKLSGGISKVVTYSDIQFDSKIKYGTGRLTELIQKFGSLFLNLVHKRVSLHPLGSPFVAFTQVDEKKEVALESQQRFVDNAMKYFLKLFPELFGRNPVRHASVVLVYEGNNVSEETIEELSINIKQTMEEIMTVVEEGHVYPSLETLPQPLPWTPLMCAVAIHDLDSIRRLIKIGVDLDYHNKDGLTALMLASQLNYTFIMTELILAGADYEKVDNKGYNCLAYSTSLPKPSIMCSNLIDILLQEEVQGPRLLTGEEVLLHAMKMKKEYYQTADPQAANQYISNKELYKGLDDLVKLNMIEAAPERAMRHRKYIKLLQRYGLSTFASDDSLLYQLKSTSWRFISEEESEPNEEQESKPSNSFEWESFNDLDFEESEIEGIEEELSLLMSKGKIRCPICTLHIPCSHFFRLNSLKLYLKKHKCTKDKYGDLKIHIPKPKKNDIETPDYSKILKEAGLDDRNTNRLDSLIDPYFKRAMQVERERRSQEKQVSSNNSNPEELFDDPITNEYTGDENDLPSENFNYKSEEYCEEPETENEKIPEDKFEDLNILPDENPSGLLDESGLSSLNNSEINEESASSFFDSVDKFHSNSPESNIEENIQFNTAGNVSYDPEIRPVSSILKTSKTPIKKEKKKVKFILPGEEQSSQENNIQYEENTNSNSDNNLLDSESSSIIQRDNELNTSTPTIKRVSTPINPQNILSAEFLDDENDQIISGANDDDILDIPQDSIAIEKHQDTIPDSKKYKIIPMSTTKMTSYPLGQEIDYSNIDKISISGWIFVHFTTVNTGVYPLESLSISSSSFSLILNHLNKKVFSEWTEESEYLSIVNPHTWECRAPKCVLCKVGYVRSKSSISKYLEDNQSYEDSSKIAYMNYLNSYTGQDKFNCDSLDSFLCLQCLYRRELYQKVYRAIPRHLRRVFDKPWPLIEPSLIHDHTDLLDSLVKPPNKEKDDKLINYENEDLGSEPLSLGKLTTLINEAKELCPSREKEIYQVQGSGYAPKLKPETKKFISKYSKNRVEYEEDVKSEFTMSDFDDVSLASTLTIADNKFHVSSDFTYGSYLISKDNFEEAERAIRNILSKPNIDDQEGLAHFEHILLLYSDLYFTMGLGSLVFLILLDFADHCASLLGPGDTITCKARARVVSTLLKLQNTDLSERYEASCLVDIEEKVKSLSKLTIKGLQIRFFKEEKQIFLDNNTFWLTIIKPIESSILKNNTILKLSSNYRKFSIFQLLGIGGFFSFLTSQSPHNIVSRLIFFNFCSQGGIFILNHKNNIEGSNLNDDIKTLKMLIKFIKLYLRIQNSEDKELKNLIFNELCTKYLSQTLISTSFLSRIFFYHATDEDLLIHQKVVNMESSETANLKIFNNFLKIIIKILLPHYRYFLLFSSFGSILRDNDINYSRLIYFSSVVIQSLVRKFLYKQRIKKRLLSNVSNNDSDDDNNSNSDSENEEVYKYEDN